MREQVLPCNPGDTQGAQALACCWQALPLSAYGGKPTQGYVWAISGRYRLPALPVQPDLAPNAQAESGCTWRA